MNMLEFDGSSIQKIFRQVIKFSVQEISFQCKLLNKILIFLYYIYYVYNYIICLNILLHAQIKCFYSGFELHVEIK